MTRILVIKLGALGDVVLALGPFQAIRRHHAADHITLLTTAPYAELAQMSGWFGEIWTDPRPSLFQVGAWLAFRRRLRAAKFSRVYDLQTSDRSSAYFRLFSRTQRPEWSGIAPGCSHPHANSGRDRMHTVERQAEQLAMAGIAEVPRPDVAWLDADIAPFALDEPFVLLVPGGAAHRPAKRWSVSAYGELARRLLARGIQPVLLGTETERDVLDALIDQVPGVVSLAGRTGFAEIAGLARRAEAAVGNDTGPMHLLAAVGCPALVLFSSESDPVLSRPRGPAVELIRVDDLAALSVDKVEHRIPRRDGTGSGR